MEFNVFKVTQGHFYECKRVNLRINDAFSGSHYRDDVVFRELPLVYG